LEWAGSTENCSLFFASPASYSALEEIILMGDCRFPDAAGKSFSQHSAPKYN